jgi:hypothetical protein
MFLRARIDVGSNPHGDAIQRTAGGDMGIIRRGFAMGSVFALCFLAAGCAPAILFYEGNAASQNRVCRVKGNRELRVGLKNYRCDNDEIRSLKMKRVAAGTYVRLYDSPTGELDDDWAEITVKRSAREIRVDMLEEDFENDTVRFVLHRAGRDVVDRLAGKVSFLEISKRPAPTSVLFHEGVAPGDPQRGTCELRFAPMRVLNFQTDPDCPNDEAKTFTIFNASPGQVIRAWDSPGQDVNDDWIEVYVRRPFPHRTLPLESNLNDEDLWLTYHRKNGLGGKVSAVEFAPTISGPRVSFFEQGQAGGDRRCTPLIAQHGSWRMPEVGCPNDEARSAVLTNVPVGTVLTVFDNPDGSTEDDWAQILVTEGLPRLQLDSFQDNGQRPGYRIWYLNNGGGPSPLDGKVSRFAVGRTLGRVLSFRFGNNAGGDKVCDRINPSPGQYRFTGECDNDAARSAVLVLLKAGTRFSVHDSPSCDTGDDWTEVTVKRDIDIVTLGSFEQSMSSADLDVVHHHRNGLDGKVSCLLVVNSPT